MPTYEYTCPEGHLTEQVCSWSARPTSLTCECGRLATPIITGGAEIFVRNRDYVFDPSKNVVSFAEGKVSAQKHHEHYRRYFDDLKKAKAARKGQKRQDMEWIGGMPGEMVDSIGRHEGDPEAVLKDPVTFLKKTGLYAGE